MNKLVAPNIKKITKLNIAKFYVQKMEFQAK